MLDEMALRNRNASIFAIFLECFFLFDTITYVELFLSKVQCQAELSHIHKLYM